MSTNTNGATAQVDVRGPRFTAWVTTAVLVLALIVSAFSAIGAAVILAAQAVVFAIGAARGPRQHPYGLVFASLIAPRLEPGHRARTRPAAEVRPAGRLRRSPWPASSGSPQASRFSA